MNDLIGNVRHYIAAGVYVKQFELQHKGAFVIGHKHNYDHLSLLAAGQVVVKLDGDDEGTLYSAPTGIVVKAGVEHTIICVSDKALWYCVHEIPEEYREGDIEDVLVADAKE